jgi:hypothetical protein
MSAVEQVAGWVSTAIVGLGGGGFLVNVLRARSQNRKETAEGSAILVNSASAYAQQLTNDLRTLRADFDAYRAAQNERVARQDVRFRLHTRWDEDVRRRLAELGETVPAAPPLYTEPIPEESS